MRSLPPLKALHAFEATARHLSVSLAAEELRVTPSAVSHQLRTLEQHLGVRLFHRLNRRLVLTDTGRSYLQLIANVFDRIESATENVISHGVSDMLTVHCPPTFAPAWLMPRLPRFMAEHPDIDLRLHATPEQVDFLRSNVDVEIRYGLGDWPGLTVVPLMSERIVPMCAPALRGRLPARPAPRDLTALPLIHSERSFVGWARWFAAAGVADADVRRGLRFDRGYLSIQAAADGLGVALESTIFATRELASGRLVLPLTETDGLFEVSAHHLVYPPAYKALPKVRKFEDWILRMAGEGAGEG